MHLPVVTASAALLTLVGIVGVPSAVSPTYSSVEQLGWLTGCLEMRSGDRVVEEHRMGVRRNSILGMGRTTSAEGLSEYELTLIYEKEGKIVFEARPSGQPAATFTAIAAGTDSVVFAAPEHDYPQIVGYRRAGPDTVLAWIEGKVGGKSRRIEFLYRRVSCPGPRG